ncbi:hypothetical protein GCM10009745_20820 [Kribbella yunnanensis]|uniref:Uncharacterized protein n=1 Tax=Kribbella yunnanensis TaxID=190194 RepID=A0ABP4SW49_9ACTN
MTSLYRMSLARTTKQIETHHTRATATNPIRSTTQTADPATSRNPSPQAQPTTPTTASPWTQQHNARSPAGSRRSNTTPTPD